MRDLPTSNFAYSVGNDMIIMCSLTRLKMLFVFKAISTLWLILKVFTLFSTSMHKTPDGASSIIIPDGGRRERVNEGSIKLPAFLKASRNFNDFYLSIF